MHFPLTHKILHIYILFIASHKSVQHGTTDSYNSLDQKNNDNLKFNFNEKRFHNNSNFIKGPTINHR
jgi:hypothetical protein